MKNFLFLFSNLLIALLIQTSAFSQNCIGFNGTLPDDEVSNQTWDRPFADGTCCSGLGPVSYVASEIFTVSTTGSYTIASIQAGWDGYLFIYEFPFDPTQPTVNYVAGDDDGGGGIGTSDIVTTLTAGVQYVLVTTAFSAGDFGDYTTTITGPGTVMCGVDVPDPGCTLICPEDVNVSLATSCIDFTIPAGATIFGDECPEELQRKYNCFVGPFAHSQAFTQNEDCIWEFPCSIQLESSDALSGGNDCIFQFTVSEWIAPADGVVNFSWSTVNNDLFGPGFDGFGYGIDGPGPLLSVSTSSGTASIPVLAGQAFAFYTISLDGLSGSLLATITNFSFDELVGTTLVQTAGPVEGTQVGAGNYQRKWELRAPNGTVLQKCVQNVLVTAIQPNLACNDHINISVDGAAGCGITLVPDMFLENFEAGCPESSYYIYVRPFGGNTYITNQDGTPRDMRGVRFAYPLFNPNGTKAVHIYEIAHKYGNRCWGTFTPEDKLPPVINCGPIRNIYCYEIPGLLAETAANARFRPTATDNCGIVSTIKVDHDLSEGCEGGILKRKWVVTDASGNTASCEQHYHVITEVPWMCPDPLVELTCKDKTDPDDVYDVVYARTVGGPVTKDTTAVKAAYPFFKTDNGRVYFNPNSSPRKGGSLHGVCNYYTTYTDQEIGACGLHCHGNKKVIRTWTILDWCNASEPPRTCTQVIKAVDNEAPTFFVKDTMVSTRPWDCTADLWLPEVWELHDNCDLAPVVTVKSADPEVIVTWNATQKRWRAVGVPCGFTQFKYTATDCCGNSVTILNTVQVKDLTPPVPVAKRDIVIGLTPGYDASGNQDAQAKLFAESVDNGSHDNCSPVRLEVRRPTGTSCGNLGVNGHNNNSTFSNNPNPFANNSASDTDGGKFVKFCCDDLEKAEADYNGDGVKDTGFHEVILRVWDDGNKNGTIGDAGDNYNETWAIIEVECKVPPVITCPPNTTIYCDWAILTNFGAYKPLPDSIRYLFIKTGLPEAYGACGTLPIEWKDEKVEWTQCETGFIRRTFRTTQKNLTRECVQIIRVDDSPFDQPWVFDPNTLTGTYASATCTEPTAAQIKANAPKWTAGPCDVIGVSTKIWEFDFEDGACKKWKVEYKYVNWCDNKEAGPFYKYWYYFDEKPPVVVCRDTMYAQGADCKLPNLTLSKVATDDNDCNATGWLKWEIFVDLWADGHDDYLFSSFVPNAVPYTTTGVIQINPVTQRTVIVRYVAPTTSGVARTITIPEVIEGKMSNHKVAWKVSDGCHNFSTCHESFMVVDKKAPTPYCVNLSTALMAVPTGGTGKPMVELWARDFDKGSYDGDLNWPCTPQEDLLFTFENWNPSLGSLTAATTINGVLYPAGTLHIDVEHYFDSAGAYYPLTAENRTKYLAGDYQRWLPSAKSSAKVWNSDALAGQPYVDVPVKMTVWDKKLNHDYCWVTLKLICNGNGCPEISGTRIAGNVKTAGDQPLNNVAVTIDANITEYPKTVNTLSNGIFGMNVTPGLDYEVTASKGGDYMNGVSTLDLVMIQRHILGIQKLDSPYKLIAADANDDTKVTASDLTDLRKLILGITNELPKNASWRFPVTAQTMDAENPFPFVERIAISQINANMTDQNFVAVKIGDVNGNVSTNITNPVVEARSNSNVVLTVAEQTLTAGEVVEILVTSANFSEVAGYQFTMNLKGGSFVSVQAGLLDVTANNVGVLSNDVVTMSYASNEGVSASENDVLFTLVVKADKAVNVSEMLTLNSDVTAAESYTSDLRVGKVSLDVRTAPVANIELLQNEPNPFKGQTSVSFVMPTSAKATISVYDVTGKVVTVRNIDAAKGLNSEIFTREQLGASGVLYYTLVSGDFTATKKMIIVE